MLTYASLPPHFKYRAYGIHETTLSALLSALLSSLLCQPLRVMAGRTIMLETSGVQAFLFQLLLVSFVFMSSVGNGNARITSTYIRSVFPSTDIPLDNEAFAVPKGHNAPQQVHITQGDYDGKGVIISWVTPDEPGSSTVQYGTSKNKYKFRAKGTVTTYTYYHYKSGYIHHCHVHGLKHNTKYYYKIGTGNSSREFWFQTPPEIHPDASYTFGLIGDLGQTYNSLSTLEHYMNSGAQAVLYVGDLSYADRYKYNDVGIRWDSWGRLVERSVAYQPWMWTVGNHDIDYFPEWGETVPFKSYLHRYPTPYTASNSSNPLWYSIRRASAHIIFLSSYSGFVKYTPQWWFLKGELAKVDREKTPWLIVIMHIPFYNSNEAHFMEGESMRAVFESWFINYKVDLIFAGHVHAYERSYRISNIRYNVSSGYCYPVPDESAPVYINIGDGGNNEGLAATYKDPQPHYSAFREASYGFATLELKNKTHAFYNWYRNADGEKVAADSVVFQNRYWGAG